MHRSDVTLVTLVNRRDILSSCLLQSPDVKGERLNVVALEGVESAAQAFNKVLAECVEGIVVFIHQDLYLPAGWYRKLQAALEHLEEEDKAWGVLGVYGVAENGAHKGHVYCTGAGKVLGEAFDVPQRVRTLDEIVLIIRPGSDLRFDECLGGFHLYGTDICLRAEALGLLNYVIPAFAVHNTHGINMLPFAFWRAYLHLWRKWRFALPIHTPCISITKTCVSAAIDALRLLYSWKVRRRRKGVRVADPVALYHRLDLERTVRMERGC